VPELIIHRFDIVFSGEGEKESESLTSSGFLATINPSGIRKSKQESSDTIKDRDVLILQDKHGPGKKPASEKP
jgi:hypothetical protein